jgi:hypothetical protein
MAAFKINLPLASYSFEIVKCFMGAFILRSSACTVNDIFDRNMDAGVGMNYCILRTDTPKELTSIVLSKNVHNTGLCPAVVCLYLPLLSI